MLAAIYARYSDSKQTEQSIEGQLKVCHNYATQNGHTVVHEYIDRALTGRNDDRVQFRKMLADSKKQQFDCVIVYALDRFGRNMLQALTNEQALFDNGVEILSATEHFENTPSGIMQRHIQMSFAQYYSEELAQKVVRGMGINAEKAMSNGGVTPLGYKIENKKYVINEETAPIVQEIFTKYANGWKIKEICDNLNEREIKTAKGSVFNKSSLNTLLKNRKYLGIYIYNGVEVPGGMPQIIDEDLFNKVAQKMELNKKNPARSRAKAEYLLTTKLFCGYCKEKMIGHSANKTSKKGIIYNYYKCNNSGGSKPCKKKMVQKDYIEDIVINECLKLLTPKNIKRIAKEVVKIATSTEDKSEIKRLEKSIAEVQKQKENQMKSLRVCDDDILRDMIFDDLKVLGNKLVNLEEQLRVESLRHQTITIDQVVAHLTKLANGDINDITYRRTLINLFINKIYLYDDKFTITFNTGDEEVTVSDKTLAELDSIAKEEKVCLLNHSAHQKPQNFNILRFLLF